MVFVDCEFGFDVEQVVIFDVNLMMFIYYQEFLKVVDYWDCFFDGFVFVLGVDFVVVGMGILMVDGGVIFILLLDDFCIEIGVCYCVVSDDYFEIFGVCLFEG